MNPYYFFPMPRFVPKNRLTEPPFSSPWYSNKRPGLYTCAVCKTPVFSSAHKYESGTGWPSFYSPYSPFSVATQIEYSSTSPDIEVHCAVCNTHLGHVFNDGPMPTGLRYCINGAALNFIPR